MNPLLRISNYMNSKASMELPDDVIMEAIDMTFDDKGDIIAELLKHPGDDAHFGKYVRELWEQAMADVIYEYQKDAEYDNAEYRAMVAEDARDRARDMKIEAGQ